MTNEEIEIRAKLERIVKKESIDSWLHTYNESFECKPIDMIGTDRQTELEDMIWRLESGMPG